MAERPMMHQVPGAVGDETPADAAKPPREPTHAERCRTLVEGARRGSLSTLAADPAGYPYGSVASYALDERGNPLFFVSLMAEHTQNALADPRASLLVAEQVPDGADPLASGRATLLGRMNRVPDADRDSIRERYLAANPSSAYYIEFGDFTFFRLDVESIRYVGGYGRMSWVDADGYAAAEADPLAGEVAAGIIAHMNADHADAQLLYCRHLAGRPDTTSATMSAVDRYGFDLVASGPSGRSAVRIAFTEPCDDAVAVRTEMVALVGEARRLAGQ
jgi:putative heme iron utilization protein